MPWIKRQEIGDIGGFKKIDLCYDPTTNRYGAIRRMNGIPLTVWKEGQVPYLSQAKAKCWELHHQTFFGEVTPPVMDDKTQASANFKRHLDETREERMPAFHEMAKNQDIVDYFSRGSGTDGKGPNHGSRFYGPAFDRNKE